MELKLSGHILHQRQLVLTECLCNIFVFIFECQWKIPKETPELCHKVAEVVSLLLQEDEKKFAGSLSWPSREPVTSMQF